MIKVLYVDDEVGLLELAKAFLEPTKDIYLETATSARDGLQRVAAGGIDVIVSDFMMPGMDGLAFLKEIRDGGDRTPFILFTGRGREDVVIQALNGGADFYLQKGGAPVPQYAELAHKIKLAAERRRTDEALKESERRFRQVLETLPIGLWLADKDGKLVLGNPAGQQIWEGNPHVGQKEYGVFKAWRLPSGEPVRADDWALGHAVNEGRSTESELLEIEAFDGTRKYVLNWAIPLKDEGGGVTGAFVINQDITAVKRVEDALREREEKYRTLIRYSSDPIFSFNPDETYRFVNEAFARPFGKTPEDIIGRTPHSLFPHDEAERRLRIVRRVFLTKERGEIEVKVVTHTGEERYYLTIADPIMDEGGTMLMVSCISKDITERKKVEDALRKSEEQNRAILEHAGIGMGFWDLSGRLLYMNALAATHMGVAQEKLVGRTMADLFGQKASEEYMARLTEAASSTTLQEYEDQVAMPSGTAWFLSIYTRVLDPSGNVAGVQILSHDITSRKRMERALHDTNQKLSLLSGVTRHDIGNQLFVISGLLQLAKAQDDPQKAAKFIDKASLAGDRIGAMIRFTKDYEEIGCLAPSWQNLRYVVAHAWAGGQRSEIQLLNDLDPAVEFLADPMIEKVFHNLMDNAANHGRTVTTLRCWAEEAEDGLKIVVEDDGMGVQHYEKERIFERGYGRDHGLGLFLAREILGITHIGIREAGVPFQGARFEMTVPKGAFRRNDELRP